MPCECSGLGKHKNILAKTKLRKTVHCVYQVGRKGCLNKYLCGTTECKGLKILEVKD